MRINILFKYLIVFSLLFIITGCEYLNRASYPEEDLVVYSGIDGASYVYSNKVEVTVYADDGKHMILTLKNYNSDEVWHGDGYNVFEDIEFNYFAWHNYYLYIHASDDVFYSLDIKRYEPGTFQDDKKQMPKYDLKKYTSKEFKKLFPDYETYEWLNG